MIVALPSLLVTGVMLATTQEPPRGITEPALKVTALPVRAPHTGTGRYVRGMYLYRPGMGQGQEACYVLANSSYLNTTCACSIKWHVVI